jgi:uncharacterized membrane protein
MSLPRISWGRLALLLGVAHFFLTAGLGLSRHWGYLTSINDLGVFDQAIWGTLNGAPFLNTSSALGVPINWLGFHFNPILLAFVPLYLVWPAAEWLILIQAAAISVTAWPLYLLARQVLQSECAAFLWAAVFLANPFVLSAAVWDFHPVSLAAPLMVLGVLAIEKRKPWLFGLTCLMLLLVQEHFGIAVAGFGVLWWLRNRSLFPAVAALCVGVAHTVLVLGVIMPALSPTGAHVMLSGDLGQLSRYAWLGESAGEIVRNALAHPFALVQEIFLDMGGGKYLALLLLTLLFTPLAGIEFLLPGLADLAANLLSANTMPRSMYAYHSISLIPLLVAAGIYGAARIASRWRRLSSCELAGFVLWGAITLSYLAAPLPLSYAPNYWQPIAWPLVPEQAVSEIRRLMPAEADVSVQGNIGAHFTQRRRIYLFPRKVGEADFVVLWLESPTGRMAGQEPGRVGSLAHHLAMPPERYLGTVERLLDDDAYGIVYWNLPWLVLAKGEAGNSGAGQAVKLYLAGKAKEWRSAEPVHGQDKKSAYPGRR